MRRIVPIVLISLIAILAASCSLGSSSDDPIVGTWKAVTINGNPLPYNNETAATIAVAKGNTFTWDTQYSTSPDQTGSGTWSVSGSTYTLTADNGGIPVTATISGTTLTATVQGLGVTDVYKKQ